MLLSPFVRCAIVQPSYIPWRGYFDIIRRVEVFVFYDDVQYDSRGWRNRNRVKTPHGPSWLTIPVHSHNAQAGIPINAIETAGSDWGRRHLRTLTHLYSRAPHFETMRPWLERVYAAPPPLLADFTIATTMELAEMLGITGTRFVRSSTLDVTGAKTERLIRVLRAVGATHYLSGPAARTYLDEQMFRDSGIALEWMHYDYREYPQLYPPYDPHTTILDLLFMTGNGAPEYLLPPAC